MLTRVTLARITRHPNQDWMVQMARRAVDPIDGSLLPVRYVLHDRDTKFCTTFETPFAPPVFAPSFVKHPYAEQLLSSFSIIISNARTKAKPISCSSLRPDRYYLDMRVASNVMNVLVDYSSFINAPHEFFDDTPTNWPR